MCHRQDPHRNFDQHSDGARELENHAVNKMRQLRMLGSLKLLKVPWMQTGVSNNQNTSKVCSCIPSPAIVNRIAHSPSRKTSLGSQTTLMPQSPKSWIDLHRLFCDSLNSVGISHLVLPSIVVGISGRVDFVVAAWRRIKSISLD